jgi:hypothetical protein
MYKYLFTESYANAVILKVFDFAFGKTAVFCINDISNKITVAASSMAIIKSEAFCLTISPLITPEDICRSSKKDVACHTPWSFGIMRG